LPDAEGHLRRLLKGVVGGLLTTSLAGMCVSSDANAGARSYDMNRFLSEPHPFAGSTVAQPPKVAPAAVAPVAAGMGYRLYDMNRFLSEPHPFAGSAGAAASAYPRPAYPLKGSTAGSQSQGPAGSRLVARPLAADGKNAKFNFEDIKKDGVIYVVDIYDPLEGLNRRVYWFNAQFDKYVYLPLVDAYRFVTPKFSRNMITNFFDNLGEFTTFANQVAQGKFGEAGKTVGRFSINSIAGLAGFFNTADELGLPRIKEDFGQTLGVWGVGNGPYLVLPIFGPSNLRDGLGQLTDTLALAAVDPFNVSSFQTNPYVFAIKMIDGRYKVAFRYYDSGSPFEYEKVRLLYTTKRRLDIRK